MKLLVPDAGLSTHHPRVLRDAIQLCHALLPAHGGNAPFFFPEARQSSPGIPRPS
jgi:hypothetical protein